MLTIGILREGKTPPDERVPLTPAQCVLLIKTYPNLTIKVQQSPVRRIPDSAYTEAGIQVVNSITDCDILFGVKEVPVEQLIPEKTYFFFSHTIKKQVHNKKLLQTILQKKIRLIDWETLKNKSQIRLIGFGRYAGIVGAYNAFYAWGIKTKSYSLKRAYACKNQQDLYSELKNARIGNSKIVLTGSGRVAGGAIETLEAAGIKKVSPNDFLKQTFEYPVYTQLGVKEYVKKSDGNEWTENDFFTNPVGYESAFEPYTKVADMYIACHFWDEKAPPIFTQAYAQHTACNIRLVADISCDINGPIASTLRASTIAEPLYGYDPHTGKETDFMAEKSIGVMAVDNLPCELPVDASEGFGEEIIKNIMPHLFNEDREGILQRATIANNGKLCKDYLYLQDYVA